MVKMYKAALKPCPFCGNAEQTVIGVEALYRDGESWRWNVECDGCHVQTKLYSTEQEALEAWKGRYAEDEVEQDGYITWKRYRQRFVDELTDNINGRFDRAD